MDLRAYISLRQRSIDLRRNLWSVDIEQCVMHALPGLRFFSRVGYLEAFSEGSDSVKLHPHTRTHPAWQIGRDTSTCTLCEIRTVSHTVPS